MTLKDYMTAYNLTNGALGKVLGVKHDAVRLWREGLREIPAKHAVAIEKATGIPRHQLRPDLWDPPGKRRGKLRVKPWVKPPEGMGRRRLPRAADKQTDAAD